MTPRTGRCLAAVIATVCAVHSALAALVVDVRVIAEGPIAVDESFVRARLGLRPGASFDRAQVTQDVRSLKETGLFERVDAQVAPDPKGLIVIYQVRARPRIGRIEVTGAERLGNRRARETLGLELGAPADEARIAAGVRRLRDQYYKELYTDAGVRWEISPPDPEGRSTVRVEVREGRPARVSQVRFLGNASLSASDLLARLQHTRYEWYKPWHWVTGAGRPDTDLLEADAVAIARAYFDRGFLDAKVSPPEIERISRHRLRVTYKIEEGPPYRIHRVTVRPAPKDRGGDQPADGTAFAETAGYRVEGTIAEREEYVSAILPLLRQAGVAPDRMASQSAVDEAVRLIERYYGDQGLADSRVRVYRQAEPELTGALALVFEIHKGTLTRIRAVRFVGNAQTKDRVLRRELAVLPGDLYNQTRIDVSANRLRNLGYFSSVAVVSQRVPDTDQTDLVFEVEEQRVGQAMLSLGFSDIDQLSGALEISHGNFDLRDWPPVGGGQKIRARAIVGTRRNDVEFSFTEPWLFERRLALGFDAFRSEKRYLSDDYNQRNTGGAISLTRPVGRFERLRLAYSLEEISIYDVAENASPIIREEAGDRLKSALTLTLSRDTRDRVFIPTRGHYLSASASFAGGPLGGETDIYSLELSATQHVPVRDGHVLSLRARAAVVDTHSGAERVPIFDRYFLGGATTIRGFGFRDVGPRDERGETIGGRSMAFGSIEYTVRLGGPFRAATFYDIGLVDADAYSWAAEPNSSWGVGLRVDIPMLPLRFDYSWPLQADAFNDRSSGRFSFLIGYGF